MALIKRFVVVALCVCAQARVFALEATPEAVLVNPTATPVRPAVHSKIDKGELLGHIQFLSSPELRGREAGTPDQLKAAQYVADEFKRYGLEPFGDEKDGQRGFFQEFTMPVSTGAGPGTALKLALGEKTAEFACGKDFAPFPAGKASAKGEGGVAFAGYGIIAPEYEYDDFGGLDLAGKWALLLRYEPQEKDPKSKFNGKEHTKHSALHTKILNCSVRRAAGVLIVTGPAGREKDAEKLTDSAGGMMGDFAIPALQITRATADALLAPAGKTIAELQAALDKELSHQSFVVKDAKLSGAVELKMDQRMTRNVVARLEGRDETLKAECVVIGAHCDHVGLGAEGSLLGKDGKGKIHPGADDNASGTAGLLELAQHFAALKPEERPKRTMVFIAFSGEEKGLLGAKHYLDHPNIPLKETAAMLNLDMIGRSTTGAVQVAGVGSAKGFRQLVEKHATDARLKVHLGAAGNGPSDHAAFYERKIPVLFFFSGIHPDYHRPSDTWEKINAVAEEAAVELAARILADLAGGAARPEFVTAAAGGYLGVSAVADAPDFTKGYPIGEVAADSPAAQAGLKSGDLITELNGCAISSPMDLPMLLVEFGPGDAVELTVKRGGETLAIAAKLGSRSKGTKKEKPGG